MKRRTRSILSFVALCGALAALLVGRDLSPLVFWVGVAVGATALAILLHYE